MSYLHKRKYERRQSEKNQQGMKRFHAIILILLCLVLFVPQSSRKEQEPRFQNTKTSKSGNAYPGSSLPASVNK